MKILIAEDEIVLQESIIKFLKRDGHICEGASDYDQAVYKVSLYDYDLIILDINLVTGSGLDLLKLLKVNKTKVAVIIVSANNSLEDKIIGLDLGADDYITKPFHLTELNSRVKAVLRRGIYGGDASISFNEIRVDTEAKQAYINEMAIQLTKKEYDLLLYFITNKNRVLSKEAIAEHLWGDHIDAVDNFDFIYVHMNNLRKKLTQVAANYIKTMYGSGYKFTDD